MTDSAHEASNRAVLWLIRMSEPDWSDEQQQEFDAWLSESMVHRAAYLRQREGWRAADRLASLGAASYAAIAQDASPGWRKMVPWALAACLAMMVLVGAAVGVRPQMFAATMPRQTFATEVGARNAVPLSDGSRVELNTATVIQAAISTHRREIWLQQGEAYFEVARKDGLPFIVHAGERDVTVLGTRFSVRRDGAKVIVAVAEGKVRVGYADDRQVTGATVITTGKVAIALGASTLVAEHTTEEIERSLAWRDGMLSFSDTRLGDVTREFNRYNSRPIRISDARAADIVIDGAFQASNVEAFVRLLRDAYGLKVKETSDGIEISAP